MLQLSLRLGEYLTIHGDIVVQLAQLSGSRAFLRGSCGSHRVWIHGPFNDCRTEE